MENQIGVFGDIELENMNNTNGRQEHTPDKKQYNPVSRQSNLTISNQKMVSKFEETAVKDKSENDEWD